MSPPLASFMYRATLSAPPKRVSSEVGQEVTISKLKVLRCALANMRVLMAAPAAATPAFFRKLRRSIIASNHGFGAPGAALDFGSRSVYGLRYGELADEDALPACGLRLGRELKQRSRKVGDLVRASRPDRLEPGGPHPGRQRHRPERHRPLAVRTPAPAASRRALRRGVVLRPEASAPDRPDSVPR